MNKINPLLKFTPEQRKEFQQKAVQTRKERAETKAKIKDGTLSITDVLDKTKDNDIIGRIKLVQLFYSLPRIGKKKADELIKKLGIDPDKRLSSLKDREKEEIKELVKA